MAVTVKTKMTGEYLKKKNVKYDKNIIYALVFC